MNKNFINFNNSRFLSNCSALCYNNSSVHLLYSIIEFREMIYNMDTIKNSNRSTKAVLAQYDINDLLYRIKSLFYFLNKNLLIKDISEYKKGSHSYKMDNNKIECTRSSDGTSNNSFYSMIYYDLIKYTTVLSFNNIEGLSLNVLTGHFKDNTGRDMTDVGFDSNTDICYLDTLEYSKASLTYYLNVFSDISENLFSFYIGEYKNKIYVHSNLTQPTINLKKYFIFKPNRNEDKINYYQNKIFYNESYCLYGLLVGVRRNAVYKTESGTGSTKTVTSEPIIDAFGHFWLLLYNHSKNNFTSINDMSSNITNNDNFDGNSMAIEYALYVKSGEERYNNRYSIKQQINHLVQISNKINTFRNTDLDSLNYEILIKIIQNKLK